MERKKSMTKFIENLYHLLEQNGITKTQFLTKFHLGKNTISTWANNDTIPNGKILIKISDYFNVSLDYLLGRTDDPILHKGREHKKENGGHE